MIGIVFMCILVVLAVVGGIVVSAIYGPYRYALPFIIVFLLTAPCLGKKLLLKSCWLKVFSLIHFPLCFLLALGLYFFHVVYSYMKQLQEEQRQGEVLKINI